MNPGIEVVKNEIRRCRALAEQKEASINRQMSLDVAESTIRAARELRARAIALEWTLNQLRIH